LTKDQKQFLIERPLTKDDCEFLLKVGITARPKQLMLRVASAKKDLIQEYGILLKILSGKDEMNKTKFLACMTALIVGHCKLLSLKPAKTQLGKLFCFRTSCPN